MVRAGGNALQRDRLQLEAGDSSVSSFLLSLSISAPAYYAQHAHVTDEDTPHSYYAHPAVRLQQSFSCALHQACVLPRGGAFTRYL